MEEYIEQQSEAHNTETCVKRYFAHLHYADLNPVSPSDYYETLKDWTEPQKFKTPRKNQANKAAGISVGLRIKSLWNPEANKELSDKKEKSSAIYAKNLEAEKESYNRYVEDFYDRRGKQHGEVNRLHDAMRDGNIDEIVSYFKYALYQDRYSVDFLHDYKIQVRDLAFEDVEKKKLKFSYKIPESDEILTFSRFTYHPETDKILPEPIDEEYQYVQKMSILKHMLLRTVAMIYRSDLYNFVYDIQITGYLQYYDDSYGHERRKNVIRFHFNKEEFRDTNLEMVNVKALFDERIKPDVSSGLYKKNPKELKEV